MAIFEIFINFQTRIIIHNINHFIPILFARKTAQKNKNKMKRKGKEKKPVERNNKTLTYYCYIIVVIACG